LSSWSLCSAEALDYITGAKIYEGEQNRSDDKLHDAAAISQYEKSDERRNDGSS